jgi:hypothetical protein
MTERLSTFIVFRLLANKMGYDIHITRKGYWHEEDESKDISVQEWNAYVDSDPEFSMDNFAGANATDGRTVRIDSPGLSVWTMHSRNGANGNHVWFILSNGNIVVKNPDVEIRNKMIEIAVILKANFQGDDGEIYHDQEIPNVKNAWWKFW